LATGLKLLTAVPCDAVVPQNPGIWWW